MGSYLAINSGIRINFSHGLHLIFVIERHFLSRKKTPRSIPRFQIAFHHDLFIRSSFPGCGPLCHRSRATCRLVGEAGAGAWALGGLAMARLSLREVASCLARHGIPQSPTAGFRLLPRMVRSPVILVPLLHFDAFSIALVEVRTAPRSTRSNTPRFGEGGFVTEEKSGKAQGLVSFFPTRNSGIYASVDSAEIC